MTNKKNIVFFCRTPADEAALGGPYMEKKPSVLRRILIVFVILLVILAMAAGGAYLAGCWWVDKQQTFFPGYHIENVDVGGMSVEQAAKALKAELTGRTFSVWLDEKEGDPDIVLTAEQLGLLPDGAQTDYTALAQAAYDDCRSGTFLSGAYDYYLSMQQGAGSCYILSSSAEDICEETARAVAKKFMVMPVDAQYTVEGGKLVLLIPKDGRVAGWMDLANALNAVRLETEAAKREVVVPSYAFPAKVITAQEIRDKVLIERASAKYDRATDSIIPDITGVDLDVAAAQQLMDAAAPGAYTTFPLTLIPATVSAETLKEVMFRDVLATYTTTVKGTDARKNNVQLSAKAINGYVLNYGDIFSYNEVVGRRTAARGYQAAPAYVGGKTVDEIGGGICQTSSTLYMSCLLANLEITQRVAHRYATAYMPYGMDATVSWGGPDYQFANNTDYPIRIVTSYVKGDPYDQLTVTLYGTKVDDIQVKMSYEYLQKINWTTEYVEDPTMAPGTERVTQSAYTGHKVQTYRELYDGAGNLISKTKESYSYYKSRNRIITRGPALPEIPGEPDTPVIGPMPDNPDPNVPTFDDAAETPPAPPELPSLPDEVLPPA